MSRIKQTHRNKKMRKLKSKLILLFYSFIFLLFCLYAFRYKIYHYLLDRNSLQIEAIIIDDKNILGKSAIDPEFTYSYSFFIEGNDYTGDSKNSMYKVGNKINVEYWPYWPEVSRPKNR